MFLALRESGDTGALQRYLDYIRSRQNSYSVVKLARDAIGELESQDSANTFFVEQLALRPSLKGLRDWAEGELQSARETEKHKIAPMVQMLRTVVDEKSIYRCVNCGYRCNQILWRCPGCEQWDTVNVIIGAEGE